MTTVAKTESKPIRNLTRFRLLRTVLTPVLLSATFLLIGAGYGTYRFGSVPATIAFLQGKHLLVAEPFITVVSARAGDQIVIQYKLTNLSSDRIQLLGMSSSCSCTIIENLPMTIGASKSRQVAVKIRLPLGQSKLSSSIKVFTNDNSQPEIDLAYRVEIDTVERSADGS
jgi:hypothetical protein